MKGDYEKVYLAFNLKGNSHQQAADNLINLSGDVSQWLGCLVLFM